MTEPMLLPGLDHIANFINALDTEGMTGAEVRSAIYKECMSPNHRADPAPAARDERLKEALEPFAEVAAWAERNGHDLMQFDMLLRHPDGRFAGHLHAQSADFINARAALKETDHG